MILVFGGSYNGKLSYVKNKYKINDEDIFYCNSDKLNLNKKVISGFHIFVRERILINKDVLKYI